MKKQLDLFGKKILNIKKRKHNCLICRKTTQKNYWSFCSKFCKSLYDRKSYNGLMPTANQLGLIKGGDFLKLEIGREYELSGIPEFGHSDEYSCDTFKIPTTEGLLSGMSKTVLGQLRSKKEKSLGVILTKVVSRDETLTVWAKESINPKGRNGISLSLFQ